MEAGIAGHGETTVSKALTARVVGSGELDVYATPMVVALAEETAWRSVAPELEEGQGTVGTKMELAHIAATPVGMKVSCDTELTEVDGRKLVFRFEAFDEADKIAEGTHERFVVDNEKFQAKANAKVARA